MKIPIVKILIGSIVAALAIMPPSGFAIPQAGNPAVWLWVYTAAGLLAFMLIYQKIDISIKALVIYLYLSCFLSKAPILSFNSFLSVLFCAYFYVLCKMINDWTFLKRILQGVLFLNVLMITMQMFGNDQLLNFNQGIRYLPICYGTVGNSMQVATFLVLLAPFVVSHNRYNLIPITLISVIVRSAGSLVSLIIGACAYVTMKFKPKEYAPWLLLALFALGVIAGEFNVMEKFVISRMPVWVESVKLANHNWLTGWGIGTFRVLFPALKPTFLSPPPYWTRCHNSFIQLYFESGILGLGFFLFMIARLFKGILPLKRENAIMAVAFLVMLLTNMMVHFPLRMMQGTLIMIAFMAFYRKEVENGY